MASNFDLLPSNVQEAYQNDPRSMLAALLMKEGSSAEPVRTPLAGLGRLSQALAGAVTSHNLRKQYQGIGDRQTQMLGQLLSGPSQQMGGPPNGPSQSQTPGPSGGIDPRLLQLANQGNPMAQQLLSQQFAIQKAGQSAAAEAAARDPYERGREQMRITAEDARSQAGRDAENQRALDSRNAEWQRMQFTQGQENRRWDMLHQMDPGTLEANAQMIAKYQTAPPSTIAMKSPMGMQLMARVQQLNPNYNVGTLKARQAFEADAAKGNTRKTLDAVNKGAEHIAQAREAIAAMKNGDFPALNSVANYFGIQAGQDPVTNYKAIINVLAPELNRAMGAGGQGGTGHERGEFASPISANMSPGQINGALDQYEHLIAGQLTGTRQAATAQGYAPQEFDQKFLTPRVQSLVTAGGNVPRGTSEGQASKTIDGVTYTKVNGVWHGPDH